MQHGHLFVIMLEIMLQVEANDAVMVVSEIAAE
jgi:hypothetical protein